ncbi:hypothetical protein [Rhizobium leguminosarum]|uniref:hypothetical protein n=1 Tax=Rhizobium leguminosarum TaxID=384 RepID=UPI0017998342|nr:hypothetical protein [Rhizobium leguminosarum]MBB4344449.1 hypothetical protein [Rhizobium leguminosarum]MBB6297521.1 hypothetical protein [Rhizobium leguminosarum]
MGEIELYVPPWTIFAGLGALERRELCNLIASFEETALFSMSVDRVSDILGRFQRDARDTETTAFARRLKEAADALFVSTVSDRALRVRLWVRIAEALDFEATLPLSTRKANAIGSGVAFKAATIMALPVADDGHDVEPTTFQRAWQTVKSIGGRRHQDFSTLVAGQAEMVAKALAEAAKSGEMSEGLQSALGERIRDHIRSLPPELRDDAMRNALTAGDKAALAVLATGTTAFSIGVGVNLAGFSAYILAAQASAFIPFMSGPAVVSTLFLLANPLFSIPAVMGIGYLANRHVNGGQAAKLAAVVAVQLALRGLSSEREGLATVLNDFRTAVAEDFTSLPSEIGIAFLSRSRELAKTMGGNLPTAFGDLEVSSSATDRRGVLLDGVLSRSKGDVTEVFVVAGLTAGDVIYNAASIDPMVLAAADFSRTEDIETVFQFGAFADRVGSMAAKAAAGAENNLRGYVSEQLVAARLVQNGHVVSFPETSNNPGFDLLVDGMPFQVKCLVSVDGLRTHFEKYPDMPVYANSELAEIVMEFGAPWAKMVFYVDGFDREIADLIMTTSMEAGDALGDLNVPYFAVAASSARTLYRVWRGRLPLSDFPLSVAMDASVKGGLSAIGGLSGKLIGLMAFGPAGALVLGGVGGVGALAGAGWAREQATRLLSSEWLSELDASAARFRAATLAAIQSKINMFQLKRSQIPDTAPALGDWLDARFADDIVFLREVAYDLETVFPGLRQPERARAYLAAMDAAKVHPLAVEAELHDLLAIMSSEPSKTKSAGKKAERAWTSMKAKLPFGA